MSNGTAPRCRLLELPVEIQLVIYEYAVTEDEPLLVNMPCDSSYRGRYNLESDDKHAWSLGEKHPPLQPSLTKTCRFIRTEALPFFYGCNIFRMSYCDSSEKVKIAIRWLTMIGEHNRAWLQQFYLYDRNENNREPLAVRFDVRSLRMRGEN
jgi:hypothetical protein